MKADFLKEYTADEVTQALKQIHPMKVPSPDGMAIVFFQKYWSIIGEVVTATTLKALNTGVFPSSLNHTFISMIPKKKPPLRNVIFTQSVYVMLFISSFQR